MRPTDFIDSALRRSPLQVAARRVSAGRLAVLAYHAIDDPDSFARQLDYLGSRCSFVSVDDVITAYESPLPPHPVLVTFDDGHPTVLSEAAPRLKARSIPAVAFVIAGLVNTTQPAWWDEVKYLHEEGGRTDRVPASGPTELVRTLKQVTNEIRLHVLEDLRSTARTPPPTTLQLTASDLVTLEASGIEIGNHTLTHPCLDRCDTSTIEAEISGATARLAETLAHPIRTFAYPNGNHDERCVERADEEGIDLAFLFDHRLATIPLSDTLRVSRVRVNSHTSIDRLSTIVSGLHPTLLRLRGRR